MFYIYMLCTGVSRYVLFLHAVYKYEQTCNIIINPFSPLLDQSLIEPFIIIIIITVSINLLTGRKRINLYSELQGQLYTLQLYNN